MRIVNLEELRKQPKGTIYCKYKPCYFSSPKVFGGICGESDFICAELIGWVKSSGSDEMYNILHDAEKTGGSFDLDTECFGRDGFFEDKQLYAIYERKDIEQLIETLKKAFPDNTITLKSSS